MRTRLRKGSVYANHCANHRTGRERSAHRHNGSKRQFASQVTGKLEFELLTGPGVAPGTLSLISTLLL